MTRNKMALPSLAMPWGRWVEENSDTTASLVSIQQQDAGSVGSLFAARADGIQAQIAGLVTVSAIQQREVLPVSVTRASTGAVNYVYPATPQTFNPPRPDLSYDFTVISAMRASGVAMPFSRSLMNLNGVGFMYAHENQQPSEFTRATYSIAGTGSITPGGVVLVEPAVASSSSGTVSIGATLWCIFSGSLA